MMGRRLKELQQTVSQRDAEIMQLKLKIDELNATLAQYRVQESAIAGALTKAQAAATGIVNDAERERGEIINAANEQKSAAELEGAEIIADAQRRAGIIESDAREKAKATAARAERFMSDYRGNARKLVAEMRRVADEAAANARRFSESMGELNLDSAIEFAGEYENAGEVLDAPVQDMPEDYVDPAALMRSIYAIEQRELPETAAEQTPAQDIPDEMETPYEEGAATQAPAEEEQAEKTPAEEAPVEEAAAEEEPVEETPTEEEPVEEAPAEEESIEEAPVEEQAAPDGKPGVDPFRSWMNSTQAEAAEEAANTPVASDESGHVWTVEEIVERTHADENADIDAELNAIIDDVLKGS